MVNSQVPGFFKSLLASKNSDTAWKSAERKSKILDPMRSFLT